MIEELKIVKLLSCESQSYSEQRRSQARIHPFQDGSRCLGVQKAGLLGPRLTTKTENHAVKSADLPIWVPQGDNQTVR